MVESPLKDTLGNVPDNLYQIVVDPFYQDDAEDLTSLGSVYVYKKKNSLFPTEDDMLVAWYVGRPKLRELHRTVFRLATFYNARVQSEIAGGGQGLLDYAKDNGFLNYCDYEPTMFSNNKETIKNRNRSYFVRISTDYKRDLITQLADWLQAERGIKVEGDKTSYILNLHKIYDKALLQELIKFKNDGNFDRISALLILMSVKREIEQQAIKETRRKQNTFFSRQFYTDSYRNNDNTLSVDEMIRGTEADKISQGIPIHGKNNEQ